jgi:hypothetical protein
MDAVSLLGGREERVADAFDGILLLGTQWECFNRYIASPAAKGQTEAG